MEEYMKWVLEVLQGSYKVVTELQQRVWDCNQMFVETFCNTH